MLACELCLHFSEQDPEQWLEDCPRRVLNIWRAYADAKGWFTDRYLAAQSAIALRRLLTMKYAKDDREKALRDFFAEAASYLPGNEYEQPEQEKLSPDALAAIAKEKADLCSESYSVEMEIEADIWPQA